MELIDTHCHLKPFLDKNQLDAVLQRAQNAHVGRMIAVSTQAEDALAYSELCKAFPKKIFCTLGLHPCYVQESMKEELEELKKQLQKKDPNRVAIGEIGLDAFHLPKDDPEASKKILGWQRDAFLYQIEWAQEHELPLIIHSRNTFDDCLDILKTSGFAMHRTVFHCFSEGAESVKRLNAQGARASFTGIVTYKNAPTTREALVEQGIKLLMLETDAPYLAPAPHRGKTNEPSFLLHTAEYVAQLLDVPLQALADSTTQTACRFFDLEP